MDFADFADRVADVEAETADLEITSLAAGLLADAGDDLPVVVRLLLGRVVPAWDTTTLDVGPSLCHEALARAAGTNVTADDVADRLAETGDIGAVAESLDTGGQRGLGAFAAADPDPLTVADVDDRLRALANADGSGSQDRKVDTLFGLFNRADPLAARYLARLVLSEMRIGVGEGTVRDAIAEAFDVPVDAVERALQVTNDYGAVAVRARDEGVAGLADVTLTVGRPVRAMLAQTGTVADALDAWGTVAVETKFDGARVQVHHDPDGETAVYSRNMADVTDALPELVEFVEDEVDVPVILDGEALAVDDDGNPLPFQAVLRRFRRKHDVARMREEVAVELRAFDCLHADGTDLLDVPLDAVERALQVTNDYGAVAVRARDEGVAGLEDVTLTVGRPVRAMLAQTGTVADALDSWGTVAVETKFDGARVQVHHDPDGETAVYSRNMADVTDALPELVEFVEDEVDVPVILDGEALAVDDDGNPLPFQAVLRRFRRKHDVARMREEVAVELRAFDCLHADGTDLLDVPLRDRRDHLESTLPSGRSPLTITDDPDAVADREAEALAADHEGIMLKNPDSAYTPGKRGQNWLKRKPDVETLDLVVTGAEWGEGRRANHLGTFLLSARDESTDGDDFVTIGKVATGISDERLAALSDRLEPLIRRQDGTEVDIEPTVVFEVGYEEIQESPTYGSGYALRFPRFVAVREDKTPADADSLSRIERLADD